MNNDEYLNTCQDTAGSHAVHRGESYLHVQFDGVGGRVTWFPSDGPGHASLELDGVSLADMVRILRVLRLGAAADLPLEQAAAYAAEY